MKELILKRLLFVVAMVFTLAFVASANNLSTDAPPLTYRHNCSGQSPTGIKVEIYQGSDGNYYQEVSGIKTIVVQQYAESVCQQANYTDWLELLDNDPGRAINHLPTRK